MNRDPMAIAEAFLQHLTSGALIPAAFLTVALALGAMVIGVIVGMILAACRMSRIWPLKFVAGIYIWIFRGTAELLQILAWYAVLPLVGIRLGLLEVALVGLGLNEGARMAEIIRGGMLAVPRGQWDAARSVGMGRVQRVRLVIAPQAARVILPPTGSEINAMFKTTSLVSTIGITELLRQSQLIAATQAQPLAIYCAAAVYYLAITTTWDVVQRRVEARYLTGRPSSWASSGRLSFLRPRPLARPPEEKVNDRRS